MKYIKPDFSVAEFTLNETIAGCEREWVGTETTVIYPAQTVICSIGGQTENIFSDGVTGCAYTASKIALGYYDFDGDGTKEYYFCWYASIGGNNGQTTTNATPSPAQKALMASVTGVSDPENWHYCEVTSETKFTDILGYSY